MTKHALIRKLMLGATLLAGGALAGSPDGKHYTNFGNDLVAPIFPINGTLQVFQNKTDASPREVVRKSVISLDDDWKSCLTSAPDDWVFCAVRAKRGWVRRSSFHAGGDVAPVALWPFRYWLHVAGTGMGGEETDMLIKAVRHSPYLVAPTEYDNIFFHVLFDTEGRAISPKTGKPTGDRVFVVGTSVYLAPEDARKRNSASWLFLGHYNEKLQALCPSSNPDSCMSAVNLKPDWPGIKELYAEPAEQYRKKDSDTTRWYGEGWVAFARHADPVQPFLYRVPDDVHMRADDNAATDAQRAKNRKKLFCLADCVPPKASR